MRTPSLPPRDGALMALGAVLGLVLGSVLAALGGM